MSLSRLKRLPAAAWPRFVGSKIRGVWYGGLERILYPRKTTVKRDFDALTILHSDVLSVGFGDLFRDMFPAESKHILEEAERASDLTLDLLGSGPVDFKKFGNGKIPWHTDFKSGHTWPKDEFYSGVLKHGRAGADVKVPWELSRCAHFVTLGQAYRITGDEAYARSFFTQIEDWIRENPPKYGVNWACPMDVALRACNWLLAWDFFSTSVARTTFFDDNFSASLFEHGLHIRRHLEWGAEMSSNHYVANLLGLLYIGQALVQAEWICFAVEELEKEIFNQTFNDGFDYESSTAYHRLVLEMFFYAAFLCERKKGRAVFSESAKERLRRMFRIVTVFSSEAGRMPLIGDNDSGRVHVFQKRDDADVRYLSQLGSLFFKEGALKVEEWEMGSELVWLFGFPGRENYRALPGQNVAQIKSKGAGESGLAVLRGPGVLVFSAQPNGLRGRGNHTHNDKLSFTLSVGGEDFFVDPGTKAYTAEPDQRNVFRSTMLHSTVEIDGEEQNRFVPGDLFRLMDDSRVTIGINSVGKEIAAAHAGYTRLKEPATHRRRVTQAENGWAIADDITGSGEHTLRWTFVVAPTVGVEILGLGRFVLKGRSTSVLVVSQPLIEFKVENGVVAPAYGRTVATSFVRASVRTALPYSISFHIQPESGGK